MGNIGKRAAMAIRERATRNGTTTSHEQRVLNLTRKTFHSWDRSENDPQAYFLQQMALAGYDVIWILTGVEKNNGKT